MARLEDMGVRFSMLSWTDKIAFMEEYRARRQHDLTALQDFNLTKQAKTRSTKAREPKEKKPRASKKKDTISVSVEQLRLLRQLGLNV